MSGMRATISSLDDSKFSVALRIRHPSVDPKEISSQLLWPASFSYMVGHPRCTPKGNPLPGTNKDSFWYADVPIEGGQSLSEVIDSLNRRLAPHAKYLEQLTQTGAKSEYFIGWYIAGNAGDSLDWKLLEACAALRIRLSFDLYGTRAEAPRDSGTL